MLRHWTYTHALGERGAQARMVGEGPFSPPGHEAATRMTALVNVSRAALLRGLCHFPPRNTAVHATAHGTSQNAEQEDLVKLSGSIKQICTLPFSSQPRITHYNLEPRKPNLHRVVYAVLDTSVQMPSLSTKGNKADYEQFWARLSFTSHPRRVLPILSEDSQLGRGYACPIML